MASVDEPRVLVRKANGSVLLNTTQDKLIPDNRLNAHPAGDPSGPTVIKVLDLKRAIYAKEGWYPFVQILIDSLLDPDDDRLILGDDDELPAHDIELHVGVNLGWQERWVGMLADMRKHFVAANWRNRQGRDAVIDLLHTAARTQKKCEGDETRVKRIARFSDKDLEFGDAVRDDELCMLEVAGLTQDSALVCAGPALRSNGEFWLKAVRYAISGHDGEAMAKTALETVTENLKNDSNFCLKLVKMHAAAMEHVSRELLCDKAFVLEAVTEDWHVLISAEPLLKSDADIADVLVAAMKQSYHVLRYSDALLHKIGSSKFIDVVMTFADNGDITRDMAQVLADKLATVLIPRTKEDIDASLRVCLRILHAAMHPNSKISFGDDPRRPGYVYHSDLYYRLWNAVKYVCWNARGRADPALLKSVGEALNTPLQNDVSYFILQASWMDGAQDDHAQ